MRWLASTLAAWSLLGLASIAAAVDPGRDVAASCAACHGTDGKSRGGVASLAGRSKEELVRAMRAFRAGERPSTIMQQLAKGYTDAEIDAAAAYLAAQKAQVP